MMMFLRSLTKTITFKKPKNPKNNRQTRYVNEDF